MYIYMYTMYTYMYTAYNTVHVHVLDIKTSLMEHFRVMMFSPVALDQLDALVIRAHDHQRFIKQWLPPLVYESQDFLMEKKSLCLSEDRTQPVGNYSFT